MQTILTNTTAAPRTVNVRREGEDGVHALVLMPGQPSAFQGEPVDTETFRAAVETGAVVAENDLPAGEEKPKVVAKK